MILKDKYIDIVKSGTALIAANFYNLETLKGLLLAAKELDSPIIIQLSKSSIDYMGINTALKMAKAAIMELEVEAWLHLDHGNSIALVAKCLDSGFDSVMIDGSELTFNKNLELAKEVVKLAETYKVPVEAELGYIAKLGQHHDAGDKFTKSDEAKIFVEQTGVDALAIAIGTAHGFYKETPKLDFDSLIEIRRSIPNTVLVLHGSSGIPHNDLSKSIELGINKINVATEFKDKFTGTLKNVLNSSEEMDLRKTFPKAIDSVKDLALTKLKLTFQK